MSTIFKIYFSDAITEKAHSWNEYNLTDALREVERLRKDGHKFVTMVSESSDMVGQAGAAGVKDGKLPSGEDYTYRKGDALSQRTKVYAPTVGTDAIEVELDEE